MANFDMVNKKFNSLVCVSILSERTKDKRIQGLFLCDCGNKKVLPITRVKASTIKTCGCDSKNKRIQASTKHGMKYTKEYNTWAGMKGRCFNVNNKDYPRYGGSGITMCSEWKNSFEKFFAHVGKAPTKNHQIDRINTLGNYDVGNVRWVTSKVQNRNKKTCYRWYIKGFEFESIIDAADFFNVKEQTIHKWVNGCFDKRRKKFTKQKDNCYAILKYGEMNDRNI
jgi:hypothetical protein